MELTFIFYLFAAFILIPGTFFVLTVFNKAIAGAVASIGMLVLFILFGIQFFNLDGTYKTVVPVSNWPPPINQCPDFFSLFKIPKTDASGSKAYYVCVDTVGVSPSGSGSITMFDPASSAVPTGTQIFPGNDSNGNVILLSPNNQEAIVQACKDKKITWAGLWNGVQMLPGTIPSPPAV